MARIIESERRLIKLSADDVFSIVREYQKIIQNACCYEHKRELIRNHNFYIPED